MSVDFYDGAKMGKRAEKAERQKGGKAEGA